MGDDTFACIKIEVNDFNLENEDTIKTSFISTFFLFIIIMQNVNKGTKNKLTIYFVIS